MFKRLAIATTVLLVTTFASQAGNIVINGDFEAGNTGFATGYCQGVGNGGCYEVVSNPHDAFDPFASFGDHTTGSGLMMPVNGSSSEGQVVWAQTVPVIPNTDYEFSAWVASMFSLDPARVEFRIGDDVLGNILSSTDTGVWQPFVTNWNSGANSEATIAIFDLNLASNGNDFALDDVQLVPEPSTLALLAIGALAVARRRRGTKRILPCIPAKPIPGNGPCLLAAGLIWAGTAGAANASGGICPNQCNNPDNGTGTVDLPPDFCFYLSDPPGLAHIKPLAP